MTTATKTTGPFAFDTEPIVDDVLAHARERQINGDKLFPFYKIAAFTGKPLADIVSRPLASEEDLKQSFFEVFVLLASLENGYICFYYVPRRAENDPDLTITLIQIDVRWEIATKCNYTWNETAEDWDIADNDKDTEVRAGILPTNVYQAIVSSMSHGMGAVFEYKLVKEFLTDKGYEITGTGATEDEDILQEMTTLAIKGEDADSEEESSESSETTEQVVDAHIDND